MTNNEVVDITFQEKFKESWIKFKCQCELVGFLFWLLLFKKENVDVKRKKDKK